MKKFLPLCFLLAAPMAQAEQDVWYDASGKVVKVTPSQKERETFVPDWKKREDERLEAQRTGNYDRGVQRSRSSWYYGYPAYYGYGGHFHHYYRTGRHHRGYSPWKFRGTYHGSGWSLRVNF